MARKKLTISGIGINPEMQLVVQKSRPLEALWKSELTLAEFKLLDLYLARINSHEPEKYTVTLEKGEIEDALGLVQIRPEDLSERLLHLGQGIRIPDVTKPKGFRLMWLFDEARCEVDENDQWKVTLSASPKSMNYFFNCDNLGYFRYKLRAVKDMTSRRTYLLFMYIEKHRNMGLDWTVSVDELRDSLNCRSERHDEFKHFNAEVLKKCQAEIFKKTECRFEYIPIRKGRRAIGVRFIVKPLSPEIPDAADLEQLSPNDTDDFENYDEAQISKMCDVDLLSSACDLEFSDAEIELIKVKMDSLPDTVLPVGKSAVTNCKIFRQYEYLRQRYQSMVVYGNRRKIVNRLKYLLMMIENDTKGVTYG